MPRVHTKKKIKAGAERRCGECGVVIQPGEQYMTWEFRYGGAHYRCMQHPPKRSDLTQSKLGQVYASIENAEAQLASAESVEDIVTIIEEVASEVQDVASEYRDADEAFGGQGATESAERADELEGWVSDLESFQPEEPDEDDEEDDETDYLDDARNEAQELLNNCPV